jgi:hypothetical protein
VTSLFLKTKTKKVPEGVEEGQAFAHCPKGSKALGGGGNSPGNNAGLPGSFPGVDGRSDDVTYHLSSGPTNQAWRVVASAYPKTTVIAYGVCKKR